MDMLPDEWLATIPGDLAPSERRVAYLDFFTRRLAVAHVFEQEAIHARAGQL